MVRKKCSVFPGNVVTLKTAYFKFSLNTVLVTLDGTDLATLPSQCWFTRLARKIPENNIERGEGSRRGTFSAWLWSVSTKLDQDCVQKEFQVCGFKCQNIGGKTGHFFCIVEVDCHDIVPFKFTKLRVIFIVAGNNNNIWSTALICSFLGMLWSSLSLYIFTWPVICWNVTVVGL